MERSTEWILDAALDYAAAGYSVIPVRSDKTPYTPHGLKDASQDPDTIRKWWETWSDANVAIACGRVSGNLVVLDVDMKNGKNGKRSIEIWEAEHGDFPGTVMANTPSGGVHYFFRVEDPSQYKNTVEALVGVDIRGDGAYVLVYPSGVGGDGKMYTWRHGVSCRDVDEVADANESVLELLRKNSRDSKPQDAAKRQRVDMHHVPEGQRNDTIFRFASKMVGSGISRDAALEGARAEVATWDNPLPDFEIVKTVDSAYNSYQPNEQNVYSDIEPEPNDDDIVVHTLDEFEEKDIEWLIPGYVPKEQITIVAGTGGVGKTSVWVSLVADLSSGKATVFEKGSDTAQYVQRKPLHVMFFSGEDTVEHVLRKKLRQEGAILKNITTISLEDKHFEKILFGSKYLEAVVAKTKPDVIIFDPLQSFIGSKAKMADRNDIRQRMRCLIEFGSRYHTTSIIVMHTNKQQGAWGRNRMADSADLWDIARSVIMCGDTETDGVKYLSHEKCNYAKPGDTILFKTEGGHATYFMKSGLKDRDFVLATNRIKRQRSDAPDVEEAEEMIMSALMEYPDGLLTKELETLLEDGGIKTWAIRKAKANLKTRKKIKYLKTGTNDPWKVKKT
jgi:hypothetical protein